LLPSFNSEQRLYNFEGTLIIMVLLLFSVFPASHSG
jgi:hypothetical protein